MSVVVIGANGLVGSALVETAVRYGHETIGTYHTTRPAFDEDVPLKQFDLREPSRIAEILDESRPHAVINCAAVTDVDACETEPRRAELVNAEAPGKIAKECADHSISFIHFSTDYVFDGRSGEMYNEDDEPNPIQVYGETKLAGERQVEAAHSEALICRLSFVYGRHGASGALMGFPAWVRKRANEGERIPLFVDQHITPTRAGDAARVTLALLERDVAGMFHISSGECVTPYEFGTRVLERVSQDAIDRRVKTMLADMDRSARRPAHTCLETETLRRELGRPRPGIDADLDVVLP